MIDLNRWPHDLPDEQRQLLAEALLACSTPREIDQVMAAFLVGDLILGLVRTNPDPPPPLIAGIGGVIGQPGPRHRAAPWWRRWRSGLGN